MRKRSGFYLDAFYDFKGKELSGKVLDELNYRDSILMGILGGGIDNEERLYIMAKIMDIPEGTDKLDVRKRINKMISNARKNAKPKVCALCGEEVTSFCNSHSVP